MINKSSKCFQRSEYTHHSINRILKPKKQVKCIDDWTAKFRNSFVIQIICISFIENRKYNIRTFKKTDANKKDLKDCLERIFLVNIELDNG